MSCCIPIWPSINMIFFVLYTDHIGEINDKLIIISYKKKLLCIIYWYTYKYMRLSDFWLFHNFINRWLIIIVGYQGPRLCKRQSLNHYVNTFYYCYYYRSYYYYYFFCINIIAVMGSTRDGLAISRVHCYLFFHTDV